MTKSDLSKIRAVAGSAGGRVGGRSTSEAKAAAARLNGKKGGRPKKLQPPLDQLALKAISNQN